MKRNIQLFVLLVFFFQDGRAQYQYNLMEDYLQLGAGNYFVHVDKESEVKKIVQNTFKIHRFPFEELTFNKGKNLFFAAYYVNPSDDNFMYVVHALRGREGYDLYFLYCANTLTHHFEYTEGKDLYQLVYDPEINNATIVTSFEGKLVSEK